MFATWNLKHSSEPRITATPAPVLTHLFHRTILTVRAVTDLLQQTIDHPGIPTHIDSDLWLAYLSLADIGRAYPVTHNMPYRWTVVVDSAETLAVVQRCASLVAVEALTNHFHTKNPDTGVMEVYTGATGDLLAQALRALTPKVQIAAALHHTTRPQLEAALRPLLAALADPSTQADTLPAAYAAALAALLAKP